MSESSPEASPDQSGDLMARSNELLKQTEDANRKANSEAGYAYNAKVAAEDHARAIAEVKGRVESDAGWFTITRQSTEQAQATVVAIRAELEGSQRAVAEAATEVEKGRAAVKSDGETAKSTLVEIQTAGAETAAALKAATQQASAAGDHKTLAETAAKQAGELLLQITSRTEKVTELADAVGVAAGEVQEASDTVKGLVDGMSQAEKHAAGTLAIIDAHEKDLGRLKAECDALHKRIESLLPNATSAGLATSFRDQKARFDRPQFMWLGTFVTTIIILLISAYVGLPAATEPWETIGRHLFNRLPLIAPLVWLAIYAGRHYGLALRLQEEYAYKEAVSAAFEGYKREMAGVAAADSTGPNPLVTLCENVLRTVGQRPGRIYEGKHEDITVLTPVASALREGVQAVAGQAKRLTGPDS